MVIIAQAFDEHVCTFLGEDGEEVIGSAVWWNGHARLGCLQQDGAAVEGGGVEGLQGTARVGAVEE